MSVVNGSLRDGMRTYREKGFTVVVLVIDEQDNSARTAVHNDQQRVLEFARDQNFPIWIVETASGDRAKPTRGDLTGSVVVERRIVKTRTSGFAETNLQLYLQAKGANILVVMGYAANQCVRYTAAGGFLTSEGILAGKFVKSALETAKEKGDPLGPAASKAVSEWVEGHATTSYCPGATQRGYVVLTSQCVQSGGPAIWEHEENVFFYTAV